MPNSAEYATVVSDLSDELKTGLVSSNINIRNVSINIIVNCLRNNSVIRLINGTNEESNRKYLLSTQQVIDNPNTDTSADNITLTDFKSYSMPMVALMKSLFVAFMLKKSARHSINNKIFEQFILKNNSNFIILILWKELVQHCLDGKDGFLRGECMSWCSSLLKKQNEITSVLKNYVLLDKNYGLNALLTILIAQFKKFMIPSVESSVELCSWKRIKPLCDLVKDIFDWSKNILKNSDKKKNTQVNIVLIQELFQLVHQYYAHLPGVKSSIQYYHTGLTMLKLETYNIPNFIKAVVDETISKVSDKKQEKKKTKLEEISKTDEQSVPIEGTKSKKHKKNEK